MAIMRDRGIVIFYILLVTGLLSCFSQSVPAKASESMLRMVFIQADSPAEVKKLSKMGIDIAAVRKPGSLKTQEPGYRVEAVISSFDEIKLGKEGFHWTDIPPTSHSITRQASGDTVYHSFDEPIQGIRTQLEHIAQNFSDIATLETIGYSLNNRPVLAMRITAGGPSSPTGSNNEDKPQVLYLATHHAREWMATQMAMRLIKYLTENFGKTERVSAILSATEVWIIPVANPDGYEYTFTNERLWRKNLRDNNGDGIITSIDGVDPNRNFNSKWGLDDEGSASMPLDETYRGSAPNSEPITQSVVNFIMDHDFKNVISYHTFGNLILYPWGWQTKTPSLDDPIFVAQAGTDENPAIRDAIMEQGYDPGVGADLYATNGDFTDWCYKMGIPASTVELTWGYDADENFYGFEFPDNESMVQTVFEDNLNYALCIAESAADPAHPVSPVGIIPEDVYHTPVEESWGNRQVIEVLARKGLNLEVSYSINGGDEKNIGFIEVLGSRYNDQSGVYFSKYRAVVPGQSPGDTVSYHITGGTNTLGPYAYSVIKSTDKSVLIISAEDYTGEYPNYTEQAGPNFLEYYTDALDASGYDYDVWDTSIRQKAPSPIDVLSHYKVVIWYTGDDYYPTVPDAQLHEDIFMNLREFMNFHNGNVLITGQDIAYLSATEGMFSDDFFQYYLGAYIHMEEGGMNREAIPYDVKGVEGDPIFDGLNFSLNGGDSAGNQSFADSFLLTSYFLPHFDQMISAGWERPNSPFSPHSGNYYVYSQMADNAYKRLGGTFTLPIGSPTLTFWISFDIETDWDYAFVEISESGSGQWTTLPDQNGLTTQETGDSCQDGWVTQIHPFLANYMDTDCTPTGTTGEWHAFNGNSSGWHQVEMDLSAYAGKTVELYISYASDWSTQQTGIFVDDIELSGYPLEDFENGMGHFSITTSPGSLEINNWIHMEGKNFPEGAVLRSPNSLYLGFGFEGIDGAESRNEIMRRIMAYFIPGQSDSPPDECLILTDNNQKRLSTGTYTHVYGTSGENNIILESGALAKLMNFSGNNRITIESESTLFSVSRSGSTVSFEGSDGTLLIMPATPAIQEIRFLDRTLNLIISSGNVKLGEQIINTSESSIDAGQNQPTIMRSSLPYNASPHYDPLNMENLIKDFSDYTFNFYHQVAADKTLQNKNIFFSTYSIENALGMTWAGSANNTKVEMANALNLTLASETFHPTLNALNVSINSRDDLTPFSGDAFQLNLVNALWSRIGYPFLPSYLDILAENYDAGVRSLDFSGAPNASRIMINQWVSDETNSKIQNLLPEGAITSDTALVLTNAIYFKASWYSDFDKALTKPGNFTLLDNTTVSAQMMHNSSDLKFFRNDDFIAVDLPYVSSAYAEYEYPEELSMLLILPANGKFKLIENGLNDDFIKFIVSSLSMGEVELTFPKFEFDCKISCKEIMRNLGMIDAFNPNKADFSNMVAPTDSIPWIDEIYHQAFIAVDEEGTEAAAATAVVMSDSGIPDPVCISMDKPFIFLIRDNITGTILFIGRVLDPSI